MGLADCIFRKPLYKSSCTLSGQYTNKANTRSGSKTQMSTTQGLESLFFFSLPTTLQPPSLVTGNTGKLSCRNWYYISHYTGMRPGSSIFCKKIASFMLVHRLIETVSPLSCKIAFYTWVMSTEQPKGKNVNRFKY